MRQSLGGEDQAIADDIADLAMLERFRNTTKLSVGCSQLWETVLSKSADSFREDFTRRGLLRPATEAEAVCASHTLPELKELARAAGQPPSGTKAALSARVLAATAKGISIPRDFYVLTEQGASQMVAMRAVRQRALIVSRSNAAAALLKHTVADAVAIARNHERRWSIKRLMPRSDMVLDIPDSERVADANWIIQNVPEILCRIDADSIQRLRMAAALNAVGLGYDKEELPLLAGGGLPPEKAVAMFEYAARFEREKRHWSAIFPMGRAEVIGCLDKATCPACAKINGSYFPVKSAPQLPHAHCTSPLGCRCVVGWHDE